MENKIPEGFVPVYHPENLIVPVSVPTINPEWLNILAKYVPEVTELPELVDDASINAISEIVEMERGKWEKEYGQGFNRASEIYSEQIFKAENSLDEQLVSLQQQLAEKDARIKQLEDAAINVIEAYQRTVNRI